jgi:hypothetical protein
MTKLEIIEKIIAAMSKLQGEILERMETIDREMDINTLIDIKVKVDLQFIIEKDLGATPLDNKT